VTTFRLKPSSLTYMSPRGLISILLFVQLNEVSFIDLSNSPIDERVLLVVILSSMLVMLIGTLKKQSPKEESITPDFEPETPVTLDLNIDIPELPDNDSEEPLN